VTHLVLEFLEYHIPLCFSYPLKNDLFGGLGSDSAEIPKMNGDLHLIPQRLSGIYLIGFSEGHLFVLVRHLLNHPLGLEHSDGTGF